MDTEATEVIGHQCDGARESCKGCSFLWENLKLALHKNQIFSHKTTKSGIMHYIVTLTNVDTSTAAVWIVKPPLTCEITSVRLLLLCQILIQLSNTQEMSNIP